VTGRPVIGVVVPAYQAEAFLGQCLRSLQAQSVPDWECVVVDDGSSDATAAVAIGIAEDDARVRMVRQDNAGPGAARNRGLRELADEVEHVAFLDSDDLWVPKALEALTALLDSRPDAVGVYGYADYIDAETRPALPGLHVRRQQDRRVVQGHRLVALPPGHDSTFADLVVYNGLWPSAVGLHRRAAVNRVSGFDESLRQQQDVDLYLRMSRHGPFPVLDEQVAWYRRHEGNLTADSQRNWYYADLIRHKTWRDPSNSPQQRRAAVRAWRYLELGRVRRALRSTARAVRSGRPLHAARAGLAVGLHCWALLHAGPPRPTWRRTRLSTGHSEPAVLL